MPGRIFHRLMRALQLKPDVYEEVEHDQGATVEALIIVVIVALATALGIIISTIDPVRPVYASGMTPLGSIIREIGGWLIWSFLAFIIGTRIFKGQATYQELLRTIGYANAPGLLSIFGFLPVIGGADVIIGFVWRLATGYVATRQALDIDDRKTVITIVLSLVPYFILSTLIPF
ncbi:MAG: hypothetical protein EXR62_11945 [Chloroflexi bacterium]|nr:hypothetical protein [Chloroflexota bacterium]